MKVIRIFIVTILLTASQDAVSQLKMSSFDTLEDKMKAISKPILVFIHTDWCIYCKNMNSTTFKNPEIIQKLNADFYFVSFNAETQETINFLGHTFHFEPNGNRTGIHSLAKELATVDDKIAYPTITVLNKNYEITFQHQSFINAKDLKTILEKISHNDKKDHINMRATF